MVPKIIHYCWFGKNTKPKLVLDCINSWKKYLPDYNIIEWNESNCILNNDFVVEAYNHKKWAFVADFIRLEKVNEFGGIYLDTDMMVLKNLDELLIYECFFGYEEEGLINGAIFGCRKRNEFITELLNFYKQYKINGETNFHEIAIPLIITKWYNKTKLNKDFIKIFPVTYFYPLPNKLKGDANNYMQYSTNDTYAVHLWNASWVEYDEFYYLRNSKYRHSFLKILKTIFLKRDFNLYYFKRIYLNFLQSLK